jgi:hypothetical protein
MKKITMVIFIDASESRETANLFHSADNAGKFHFESHAN